MVNLALRDSSEQTTFAPYEDDPNSPTADRVRLLDTDHPSHDHELLSDDGLEDQTLKRPSALHQIFAKAGTLAVGVGKLRKKRDGVKRTIGCCKICCVLFLVFVIWIIITVSKFRAGPKPTVNWTGENQVVTFPLSSALKIKYDHTPAHGDKKSVRVGQRVHVVQATDDDISLSFDIKLTDESMMDLVKIVLDKEDDGSLVIETVSLPSELKVKKPRIEILATLSLPKSASIPKLDIQNLPVIFMKTLTASTDRLNIKASAGKIDNKSKNFRIMDSASLELGAGDISGDWSLPRESFDIDVKAGEIDIDVYPLDIEAADYNTDFRTEVGAGKTKIEIHAPDSADHFPQKMTSKHVGGAGKFKLEYPSVWAGTVNVDGNSAGKVEIHGDSVDIVSEKEGRIRKAMIGQGNSKMNLELSAGDIELEFED